MFRGCSTLIALDLSKFNTYNVEDMDNIFYDLNDNCNIITSDKNLLIKLNN